MCKNFCKSWLYGLGNKSFFPLCTHKKKLPILRKKNKFLIIWQYQQSWWIYKSKSWSCGEWLNKKLTTNNYMKLHIEFFFVIYVEYAILELFSEDSVGFNPSNSLRPKTGQLHFEQLVWRIFIFIFIFSILLLDE
jgi:hypothetical protein